MANKTNHRRRNKPKKTDRVPHSTLTNGYERRSQSGYLDKSMHGWGTRGVLSDTHIGAGIGNDFCNGNRGMARAVKGAKKFVRSRLRFHENAATRSLKVSLDD